MKTEYFQIAFELKSKPGKFNLLSASYPDAGAAVIAARNILNQSAPRFRARSFKVFEITRRQVLHELETGQAVTV